MLAEFDKYNSLSVPLPKNLVLVPSLKEIPNWFDVALSLTKVSTSETLLVVKTDAPFISSEEASNSPVIKTPSAFVFNFLALLWYNSAAPPLVNCANIAAVLLFNCNEADPP